MRTLWAINTTLIAMLLVHITWAAELYKTPHVLAVIALYGIVYIFMALYVLSED